MRIYSSLFLLGALGVLSAPGLAAPPVDTSAWTCESCPYPKGTTGSVDVGVGTVSDDSAKFGDYTGLESEGPYLLLGGNVSHRGEDGYFADLTAADLGIDTRTLDARAGRAGLYSLRLRLRRDPAALRRRRRDAVPGQWRQRAVAAAGLSRGDDRRDAAGHHAAAGGAGLQALAPRPGRRLDRRRELVGSRQPAPATSATARGRSTAPSFPPRRNWLLRWTK